MGNADQCLPWILLLLPHLRLNILLSTVFSNILEFLFYTKQQVKLYFCVYLTFMFLYKSHYYCPCAELSTMP
jgi:hypothetical protein